MVQRREAIRFTRVLRVIELGEVEEAVPKPAMQKRRIHAPERFWDMSGVREHRGIQIGVNLNGLLKTASDRKIDTPKKAAKPLFF